MTVIYSDPQMVTHVLQSVEMGRLPAAVPHHFAKIASQGLEFRKKDPILC